MPRKTPLPFALLGALLLPASLGGCPAVSEEERVPAPPPCGSPYGPEDRIPFALDLEPFKLPGEPAGTIATASVRRGDLLGDGSLQLFATEPLAGAIHRVRCTDRCEGDTITEGLNQPVRVQVVDLDRDGDRDLLVADIGNLFPTDDPVGRVVLLENQGGALSPKVLLQNVGRVACAEAADLDADGDLDVVTCVFGHTAGQVGFLEQTAPGEFTPRLLDARPGAIHAFPFDADGDGDLDVAAVLAQTEEEVMLYRNDGKGGFRAEVLFSANDPDYGMAGIELGDLDGDCDLDILVLNGDAMDVPMRIPPPDTDLLHGIAWLENDGKGAFTHHEIDRFSGAYGSRIADLDRDGDMDVVTSSNFTGALGTAMLWFENDGRQSFTRHEIEGSPRRIGALELGDVDGDGDDDVLAAPLLPEASVTERLFLLRNRGADAEGP